MTNYGVTCSTQYHLFISLSFLYRADVTIVVLSFNIIIYVFEIIVEISICKQWIPLSSFRDNLNPQWEEPPWFVRLTIAARHSNLVNDSSHDFCWDMIYALIEKLLFDFVFKVKSNDKNNCLGRYLRWCQECLKDLIFIVGSMISKSNCKYIIEKWPFGWF